MYSRIITYQKDRSFFLFGPRGTGKSSWLRETFGNNTNQSSNVMIDLLDDETFNRLNSNPKRVEDLIVHHKPEWVIIDEVQKNTTFAS